MKIQWYTFGVLFLLSTCVVCEEGDEEEQEGFSNFLSSLFNGWFDSPSPEAESDSNITSQVVPVNSTTDDIPNIEISNGNTTVNVTLPDVNGESQDAGLPSSTGMVTPLNENPTPSEENEQQTELIASIFRKLEDKPNGQNAEAVTPTSTSTKKPGLGEICQANPDMTSFCALPEIVVRYLQKNTSIEYLSRKIFNCDVVEQLQNKCAKGEWCLPSKTVYDFMQLSDSFLGGSLCSPKLRTCLKGITADQEGCPMSTEIYNIHVALDLLCKLGSQEGLTYECFGHVMAMLHVNLADALRTDQVNTDDFNPDQCHLQKGLQIKHFICIRDLCTYQTDTIKSFEPWQWFVADVASFEDSCKYRDVCGLQNQVPTITTTVATTTTTVAAVPEVNNAAVDDEEKSEQVFANTDNKYTYHLKNPRTKTKVLIGISSAVLIATFGLTMLICALWYHDIIQNDTTPLIPNYQTKNRNHYISNFIN
ncbi:hypothetical protein LOTGIDRAFT_238204 [Lottia gigantea]|uniref:Uncharacterized protein n=1 Tax=Lottia gigantea TaxID=225164 RepID=V4B6G3_LOTGI|nr:hypothetical protein LOTGIDRAFT_238204 [Lottia gigantea]ESP01657.1 hypothetical protein LOTGIDRAFT_238204 [Lottia gigantea]